MSNYAMQGQAPYSAGGLRTPSPTPSEALEEQSGVVNWQKLRSRDFWLQKKFILWYIIGFFVVLATTLITIYHQQIVAWLTPAASWMRSLSFGWLIPIAILFVISFPPLFGHEIIAILCGVVWGLWIGFAIVAAGTFIGEVGNFYAFKYCCHARGEKMEKTETWYACLAKVVREGGFKIALIARLSAIPGHFTTAVFATCGMSIWVFCLAAFLSLPKQFVTVYLGYLLAQSSTGTESTGSKVISDVLVAVSLVITVFAAWWIYRKMMAARPEIFREKRKQRAYKMTGTSSYSTDNLTANAAFDPNSSDSELPLSVAPQRWDGHQPAWQGGQHGGYEAPESSQYSAYPVYDQKGRAPGINPAYGYSATSSPRLGAQDMLAPTPTSSSPTPRSNNFAAPQIDPYRRSNESLQLPALQPAPSALDSSYIPSLPAQPQPYLQPHPAARTPSPSAAEPRYQAASQEIEEPALNNPFENGSSELPYTLPTVPRVASPGTAMAQSQPSERPPFDITFASTAPASQGERPRGVQLKDG